MSNLAWREWDEAAFATAERDSKPVLLYLKASWCRFCRELETTIFNEPTFAGLLQENFVPVCVDKDRRPDIDQRYNLGGWPTLAVLTPDGDLVTGGSDLNEDEVRTLIERAAAWYHDNREQLEVQLETIVAHQEEVDEARRKRQGELTSAIVDHVAKSLLDSFDRRHGGFGSGQKFPHDEALDFAILHYAKTKNPSFQELVQKTLTAMSEGQLFDSISGSFFRFCGTRDWRQPETEILLETQAGLLRNYLEAYQLFDRAAYRKTALKIVSYLEHGLRDPETGGYFGSQDSDDEYYALDEVQRGDRKPPRLERTLYTNSIAMTISSLYKAGSVLADEQLHHRATEALSFLLETLYLPGRGMYHYWDGRRHMLGLLRDQIYMARALIHAVQYTGDNSYIPIAEDLISTIVKKQATGDGGFYDISKEDARRGLLRRRNTSLLENAVIAEVLLRLSCLTGRKDYRELAEGTLRAFASDFQLYGYFMAGYARAVELLFEVPVQIFVVGKKDDPVRQEMLRVAQSTYVSSRMILAIDPTTELELLDRHGFPGHAQARTYLCLEHACVAEIESAGAIAQALVEADARRRPA